MLGVPVGGALSVLPQRPIAQKLDGAPPCLLLAAPALVLIPAAAHAARTRAWRV